MKKAAGLLAMLVVLEIGTAAQARTPGYVCKADSTCQAMTTVCIRTGLYRPRRCRRMVVKDCKQLGVAVCARELAAVCQHVSDPACPVPTTTTTLPPVVTTTTSTTTTTLPAGPDYSVYSGSWGYAANYQNYVGCPTYYPEQLSGTLQLSVSPAGSIVGSVDGAIGIAGSFTSYSSASVSSQVFSDVWGCASTFDADVTSFSTTQGVLEVYISQQCPGGPVCADYYVGAVAR